MTREERIAKGPTLDVLCPAGTTFDAAEALRLELVAKLPAGVVTFSVPSRVNLLSARKPATCESPRGAALRM